MADAIVLPGTPPAPPANAAEARTRLDALMVDKERGAKLLAGDAEVTREYRELRAKADNPDPADTVAAASAQSMATIASRLAHDERVLAAIREEDEKRIRSSAPRAISALSALVENPKHKDHARGIAMVLDRVHPLETVVKINHDATPAFNETAEVLARIAQLAAKFGVALPAPPPRLIEGRVAENKPQGAS
jgi:hypothetical protein